ncbi:MAG: tryptophan 2,3-dioxygenase [Gammaproteobacteria bacterium]
MTTDRSHVPQLEPGIHVDLKGRRTYADYLCLDRLLDAQNLLSDPPHHDELLFIIQHQTSELWFKLTLHELKAACAHIRRNTLDPCFKILARVKMIQRQLFEQWGVLETLTPSEYARFRHVLGPASGLQSAQYRSIEYILGNKNAALLQIFKHDERTYQALKSILESPSIYDEFLMHLQRRGHAVPDACIARDWSQPYERNPALIPVFKAIYDAPHEHWDAYNMCEKLVDVEENFLLWRFRYVKTVERIIGYKRGTGGSSGVAFLKQALDLTFFPELLDVRTEIGTP